LATLHSIGFFAGNLTALRAFHVTSGMLRSVVAYLPSLRQLSAPLHGCKAGPAVWGLPAPTDRCIAPLLSQQQQWRSVISVKVYNNKVDAASRALGRIIVTDKVLHTWRKKDCYLKPAAQRVVQQKETALRLKKRNFKQLMRLAMQRKDRGY